MLINVKCLGVSKSFAIWPEPLFKHPEPSAPFKMYEILYSF